MSKNSIRAEMTEHGELNQDVADFLGISVTSVSRKLNGKNEFTKPQIKKLAEHWDLSPQRTIEVFFN